MVKSKSLIWGISQKADGSMKLSGNKIGRKIINNRKNFFLRQKIDLNSLIWAGEVHGNRVTVVDKRSAGKIIKNCDGLITADNNIVLAVTVADCLPVYLYEPKEKVIGLIHLGWRGLVKKIAVKAVDLIKKHYQINPLQLKVWVGPYIKVCHYEIKNDLVKKFKNYSSTVIVRNKKIYFDLAKVLIKQLQNRGVMRKNIKISRQCTYHSKIYFSYRRDQPKKLETMVAYLGLK